MTLIELIARQQAQITARLAERQTHTNVIANVRNACVADSDRNPSATEEVEVRAAVTARAAIDEQITILQAKLAEWTEEQRKDDAALALAATVTPTAAGTRHRQSGGATVSNEARTYTVQSARQGVSIFRDMMEAQGWNPDAQARLGRHMTEARVDQNALVERAGFLTGGAGGLVVPQYLPDLVALPLRNGRPFANLLSSKELPADGMSIIVPRVTTALTAAVQATQNTAVSNTDSAVTNLTVNVNTYAGQQDISRQLIERGTGIDTLIYSDLARAYAAVLDSDILYGLGSGGTHLGVGKTTSIQAATVFGAAPTVGTLYSKIAGIIAAIAGAGAGIDANLIVMHPRRWGWLSAQVDSNNRPIVLPGQNSPYNATAVSFTPGQSSVSNDPGTAGATVVGSIHGLPVITDANLPVAVGTESEDIILVVDTDMQLLWETGSGAPGLLRFEQTTGGSLMVKVVAYGYSAFSAGRFPQAAGIIGGLDTGNAAYGLVAPSF